MICKLLAWLDIPSGVRVILKGKAFLSRDRQPGQ
jgi:hypothetical protein